jgi:hypothetical protein
MTGKATIINVYQLRLPIQCEHTWTTQRENRLSYCSRKPAKRQAKFLESRVHAGLVERSLQGVRCPQQKDISGTSTEYGRTVGGGMQSEHEFQELDRIRSKVRDAVMKDLQQQNRKLSTSLECIF